MSGSEAELYFIQYQHNGALHWLQTGSTDTIMMRMAAVQGRTSCFEAPERKQPQKDPSVWKGTMLAVSLLMDTMCPLTQCATQGPWKMKLLHLEEHIHLPVRVFRSAHVGCPASLAKQELCYRTFLFKSSVSKLLSEKSSASQASNRCHWVWDTDENSAWFCLRIGSSCSG